MFLENKQDILKANPGNRKDTFQTGILWKLKECDLSYSSEYHCVDELVEYLVNLESWCYPGQLHKTLRRGLFFLSSEQLW